VTHLLVGTSTV